MTSGRLFLLLYPQMLLLALGGSPGLRFPNGSIGLSPPLPHPPFIMSAAGGDGSLLERGPEDPGTCRIERSGGGVGMGV